MTKVDFVETVSNTAVLDLLETCRSLGLIDDNALGILAINQNTLKDPALRFSEKKLITLWHWLAEHSQFPEIGLLIGQTINPSAKGLLASWVSQTESLGEALEIFSTNIALMNPSEHWDIKEHNGVCTLQFSFQQNKHYPTIAIERSMSAMVTWGRLLSGHKLPLIHTHFSFPATSYSKRFTDIFGHTITYGMPENSLRFEGSLLKLPIVSGNQFLKSIVEDKAKSTLETLTKEQFFTLKTKAAIEKLYSRKSMITIDSVCHELALSRQTLYRKLKDENCDFKSLNENHKQTQALKLLQLKSENITSISHRLGYQDTSSFYKAFKRWFGMTPSSYINSLEN